MMRSERFRCSGGSSRPCLNAAHSAQSRFTISKCEGCSNTTMTCKCRRMQTIYFARRELRSERPRKKNNRDKHKTNTKKTPYQNMDTEFQMDDGPADNTWKSCCLSMDRQAVQYFTQLAVISSVMSLCIYKLATDSSCEVQTSFTGLLTLLIGVLIPSPKFK